MVQDQKAEDLNNYIAFTLEALDRLGWTGKIRLNRFLATLTAVSSEATEAKDATAYAQDIKDRMSAKGVVAFKNADEGD